MSILQSERFNPEIADHSGLVVVVPALNEATRQTPGAPDGEPYRTVLQTYRYHSVPLMVGDDGSSDKTGAEALSHGFPVFTHDDGQNHGKWTTLKLGVKYALENPAVKAIGITDADGSYGITDMLRLHGVVASGQADIAVARRIEGRDAHADIKRRLGHIGMAKLGKWVAKTGVTDAQAGLKVFNREAAELVFSDLPELRWLGDIAVLAAGRANGLHIAELDTPVRAVEGSRFSYLHDGPRLLSEARTIRRWLAASKKAASSQLAGQ